MQGATARDQLSDMLNESAEGTFPLNRPQTLFVPQARHALTPNGGINEGGNTVVVDPSGRFAYVGSVGVSMYSIDATTGKLTSMGTVDA